MRKFGRIAFFALLLVLMVLGASCRAFKKCGKNNGGGNEGGGGSGDAGNDDGEGGNEGDEGGDTESGDGEIEEDDPPKDDMDNNGWTPVN